MKLAEALLERADVQKRLAQMGGKLNNNARVQEGEKPAEDPKALLKEQEALTARLETLVAQINLTNSGAMIDGQPMTLWLSRRDARREQLQQLRNFLDVASSLSDRARMSEIKIISTVDVAKLQKELDSKSKALRELDAKIQAANWTVELIEAE